MFLNRPLLQSLSDSQAVGLAFRIIQVKQHRLQGLWLLLALQLTHGAAKWGLLLKLA